MFIVIQDKAIIGITKKLNKFECIFDQLNL